jgi:hypothetical protein
MGKWSRRRGESVAQPENAPEYLQRYSKEHLLYEVQMFFQVGHLLMISVIDLEDRFSNLLLDF